MPPASELIQFARQNLKSAIEQDPGIGAYVEQINQAEYNYLDAYIDQQRFGGRRAEEEVAAPRPGARASSFRAGRPRPPPGGTTCAPSGAGSRCWRRPAAEAEGAAAPWCPSVPANGLTAEALARYAARNDSLKPLQARFEERSQTVAAVRRQRRRPRPPARRRASPRTW